MAIQRRQEAAGRFSLPPLQSAKAELYRAFRASSLHKAEFARRLNMPNSNVDRLFNLGHRSRLDQLEAAFAVLKKKMRLEVVDAAAAVI